MGVTKYSPAFGAMLCDRLVVNPAIAHAAKFLSITEQSIFLWMRASARDQANDVPISESKWAILWPNQEGQDEPPPQIFLHEGVIQAQKLFRAIAETQLRALLASPEEGGGQVREVFSPSGLPVFEVDNLVAAQALSFDDFEWEITYGHRARSDVFKRDGNGALIPKKVRDPLPSQTLIHLARSLFGDTFNPSDRREIDTNIKVETLILGSAKPAKAQSSLRDDLERRLAEIRADPNRATSKPSGPVAMIGRGNPNDPPERVTGHADDAPARLADNPRAYMVPVPTAPRAVPNYARPNRNLDQEGVGRGIPPAGGIKVS